MVWNYPDHKLVIKIYKIMIKPKTKKVKKWKYSRREGLERLGFLFNMKGEYNAPNEVNGEDVYKIFMATQPQLIKSKTKKVKKYKYSREEWLDYYEDLEHIHITKEAKEDLLAKESNEEYSQRIMMEQVPKQEDNKECGYISNKYKKQLWKNWMDKGEKLDIPTPSPLDNF